MANAIQMPKLSDTMTEGTIRKWLVHEGAKVNAGDPIAEVETDKATLEMEAYEAGTILKILVGDGSSAGVGGPIAVIGKSGEDWEAAAGPPAKVLAGPSGPAPEPAEERTRVAADERQAAPPQIPEEQPGKGEKVSWKPSRPAGTSGLEPPTERPGEAAMRPMAAPTTYRPGLVAGELLGITYGFGGGLAAPLEPAPQRGGVRVRATPLARKLADERGVDLAELGGSGPGGRIVRADVEGARASAAIAGPRESPAALRAEVPPTAAPAGVAALAGRTVPLSQMRKAIARAMAQAKREIPHFYLTLDVDMSAAVALRQQAKAAEIAVSPNDLVLRAVAVAAREMPEVLGVFREEQGAIEFPAAVHLGFATALDDGLITPVIRDADRMSIGEIARQVRELAAKAREKRLKPEEYQGATITVSNLGMYDIEHFYAIVNPPQSSIVSVGKLREEPVVKDGQIVVGQRMRLGYSGDHRVVDGAVGARFLQALKRALENPLKMLLG